MWRPNSLRTQILKQQQQQFTAMRQQILGLCQREWISNIDIICSLRRRQRIIGNEILSYYRKNVSWRKSVDWENLNSKNDDWKLESNLDVGQQIFDLQN